MSAGSDGKNHGWQEENGSNAAGETGSQGGRCPVLVPHAPRVEVASLALNSPGLSTPSMFLAHRGDAVDPPDCFTTANFAGNSPNGFRVPRKLNRERSAS